MEKMTRFEDFQLMYPTEQIELELSLTNENLKRKNWSETTFGELMKFCGIMLLMTMVWFQKRKELWNKRPSYKYIPANEFGMTGMTYHHWIELWHCIQFSYQPPCSPCSMGPAAY